ncbi:MAG TPA: hypothetical protein VGK31_05000 [Thermoanaerobaculia bacterium]|jgi:hypothetical protein
MLRKLNFTERLKLPRNQVRVTLRREPDGVLAFDPALSFEGIAAPSHARVYIEAYHRTSFMRFDCGSVGALSIPSDRRLIDIDGSSVRFRIKVVDAHRILAVAEDIRVTERAPDVSGRVPLLPVQFTDALGEQAWRVVFEPDTPVLELNNRTAGIETMARDDALFFALVYPAAVRAILTQILLIDGHDTFDDSTEWWALWILWASRQTATPPPSDADDAPAWIEDVVSSFSSHYRLVDRINAS